MKQSTRNQLEVRLKEMIDQLDQPVARQKPTRAQPVSGDIIRRRKGEKDKRFSICRLPILRAAAAR